uniref:Uncharacterized protein n=1 Tax=Plectus sambesii TaxID=2011161 RepID=A0A914VQJ0_9BILA
MRFFGDKSDRPDKPVVFVSSDSTSGEPKKPAPPFIALGGRRSPIGTGDLDGIFETKKEEIDYVPKSTGKRLELPAGSMNSGSVFNQVDRGSNNAISWATERLELFRFRYQVSPRIRIIATGQPFSLPLSVHLIRPGSLGNLSSGQLSGRRTSGPMEAGERAPPSQQFAFLTYLPH